MTVTYRMSPESMIGSRFVVSHLTEAITSLRALREPHHVPYAAGWARSHRRRLRIASVPLLMALTHHTLPRHPHRDTPDFLAPIPPAFEMSLDEELDALATTDPDLVRRQLRVAFRIGPVPDELPWRAAGRDGGDHRAVAPRILLDLLERGGEAAVAREAAEQVSRYWTAAMADHWPSIRAVHLDDIRQRAAQISRMGARTLLAGLHPSLDWTGHEVRLPLTWGPETELTAGVVLVPSVFLHAHPRVWIGTPGGMMIGYPALGRGNALGGTAPDPRTPTQEFPLSHRVRALLSDLNVARSTTELAHRHRVTPPTISHHVRRLHRAGLVERRREGKVVLYQLSPRGSRLTEALNGDSDIQTR